MATADFNRDGRADLATVNAQDGASGSVSVLLGDGSAGFAPATSYSTGDGPGHLVTGDFNHDGNLDIATANPSAFLDNVSVLLGHGDGTFGTATNYTAGTTSFALDLGDFNQDNNLDLVVANFNSANISILMGNGSGGFGTATNVPVGVRPVFIKAGDFNRDNHLDAAVSDSDSNAVWVLLGNGAGGFSAPTAYPAGLNVRDIAVADLDHDGILDIAVANTFSNTMSILMGNGSGGFDAPHSIATSRGPNSVSVADLNGDGNLDLAAGTNFPAGLSVLPGDGTGGFGPPTNFPAGSFPRSVAIADYNGDGGLDMATANTGSNNVSVLLNNCHPTATGTPTGTPTGTATRATTVTVTSMPTNTAVSSVTVTLSATASATAARTTTSTAIASSTRQATVTSTATTTPTTCTITFSDVPPGSTFYTYIECLACRGIISGYQDGTFRPSSNVTRGQAAKIVANSAGYDETIPPTKQTFSDVTPGSTFWIYIERVALHGAISGYSDGTFRPNNNVTRGQLAKIDAEVKGYDDVIPPTQQTFSDVAPGSTFWVYIERVALHNVVSGYSDATFRPFNSVTRGQTSKIVSLTFSPNCQTLGRP